MDSRTRSYSPTCGPGHWALSSERYDYRLDLCDTADDVPGVHVPRRRSLAVGLESSSFPKIDEFLREFASKIGWDQFSTDRLRSAGEETLASLLQVSRREDADGRRLTVTARLTEDVVELEFLAASEDENLQDRLAYLDEQPETPDEREISFRLLRHYASSVNHRQYHNLDVVTVQVSGSR